MRSRRVLVVAALVAAGLYGATPATGPPVEASTTQPQSQPGPLVAPTEDGGHVWPYTSRRRSTAGRTLALNVVVRGDSERVRKVLVDRAEDWSAVDRDATAAVSPWRPAHGSTRYTYVTPDRGAAGRWIASDYQLAVGPYFGRRTHVRGYAGPSGDWTALQAHTEYWDWFRVRHTVTGVERGAAFVERDLRDEPFVGNVSRTTHGHTGGGSDGRWRVVELLPAALAVATALLPTTQRPSGRAALPAALVGVVLGVRAWGLAAQAVAPTVTPKLFVALGYPVLAVGPPVLVAVLGRDDPVARVAPLAAAGLAAGVALDLVLVGVRRVPLELVGHRLALVTALGVVAVGVGREDRWILAAGVTAWVGVLAAPLVGVV